jgi:hypothetical protein
MERLPIWLSAVGERTAGPGTADMNRFPLNGMHQLRLPMALIERPVQGHSNEEGTGAPQQGSTAVRTVCFCFHYDGSRKNVNKIFKNSSAEGWKKSSENPPPTSLDETNRRNFTSHSVL